MSIFGYEAERRRCVTPPHHCTFIIVVVFLYAASLCDEPHEVQDLSGMCMYIMYVLYSHVILKGWICIVHNS